MSAETSRKKGRVDKTRCFTVKHFQTSTGHHEGAAQLLVRLQMLCLGTGVPREPAGCELSARCLPLPSVGDAPYWSLIPPNGMRSVSGASLQTWGGKEETVRSRWKTRRSSALSTALRAGRSSDGRGLDKKRVGSAVLLPCGSRAGVFLGVLSSLDTLTESVPSLHGDAASVGHVAVCRASPKTGRCPFCS